MMPMGSPSTPTTRTSFALISSLINNSFALILKHPQNFAQRQKKSCEETSPHDTRSPERMPKGKHIYQARHLAAGWERRAFCFFFLGIISHLRGAVNRFLKNFYFFLPQPVFSFFRRYDIECDIFEKHDNIKKKTGFSGNFFVFCIVLHEKFDKKSSILDIAFFLDSRYNNNAVGGTNSTAHAQRSHRSCGVSSLWYQRASMSYGCAFFNPSRRAPGFFICGSSKVPWSSCAYLLNIEQSFKLFQKLWKFRFFYVII